MKNKVKFTYLNKTNLLSGMKVKINVKKSEPACMLCLPSTPLKDHPSYNGSLVHSRIDCPPGHIYFINDEDFINNWE